MMGIFSYYLQFKILNNDSYYHPGVVLANRRIRLEEMCNNIILI